MDTQDRSIFKSQASPIYVFVMVLLIIIRLSPEAMKAMIGIMDQLKDVDIVVRIMLLIPVVILWLACALGILVLAIITLGAQEVVWWIEIAIVVAGLIWSEVSARISR